MSGTRTLSLRPTRQIAAMCRALWLTWIPEGALADVGSDPLVTASTPVTTTT